MRVLVPTCNKYDHLLPGFAYCFNKYWSDKQQVTVLGYRQPPQLPTNFVFHLLAPTEDKPFTCYLNRYIKTLNDPYFAFILDDHWLIRPADKLSISRLEVEIRSGASKAHMSSDTSRLRWRPYKNNLLIADYHGAKVSLQASIWNRDYMLRLLNPDGITQWEFEGLRSVTYDRAVVVGFKHEVYPKPGIDGVYRAGKAHEPNIQMIAYEDRVALKQLGYTEIMEGKLTYDPSITVV